MKRVSHGQLLLAGLVAVILLIVPTSMSQGEVIVTWPSEYENAESPDVGGTGYNSTGGRNQWLIPSEAFSGLPETHRQLIGFNWRPDGNAGRPVTTTMENTTIHMSTTSRESLSDTFAENVGDDVTLVYDGPMTLSTMDTGPEGGPKDYDIEFRFQEPFFYDPAGGGNLLFDQIGWGPFQSLNVDAWVGTENDPITSVWALDRTAQVATGGNASFVPTQLIFVPEPATFGLIAIGLAVLLASGRRSMRIPLAP